MRSRETVRMLLFNSRGHLLLIKIDDPGVSDPSKPWLKSPFWVTLGGKVERDEDLVTAARREIHEETGIDDVAIGPVVWYGEQVLHYGSERARLRESFVVARTARDRLIKDRWTREERRVIVEMRWWTIDELERTSGTVLPPVLVTLIRRVSRGDFDDAPQVISLIARPNET